MRLLSLILTFALPAGAQTLRLTSSVDGGPATAEWKYVRMGQQVVLQAELKPEVPGARFRWHRIEPTSVSVDNTSPQFHFHPIAYRAIELLECRGQARCPANAAPSLGTMAFQLTALLPDGRELRTPGAESIELGGLSRQVHKVAVRADDSYLGYLTELINTPYIFGSSGPEGRHQADLLIGSDCADLAVYGQRRLGKPLPYVSTFTLDRHAPVQATAVGRDVEGIALDARGRPLRIGEGIGQLRVGDVLHFPASRHVGVLYEDRPPLGVLDEGDLMFHTCWAPPTAQPIGESGCASWPVRILRFR